MKTKTIYVDARLIGIAMEAKPVDNTPMLLINYTENYADEFDVLGQTLMSQQSYAEAYLAMLYFNYAFGLEETKKYFGTNESIELNSLYITRIPGRNSDGSILTVQKERLHYRTREPKVYNETVYEEIYMAIPSYSNSLVELSNSDAEVLLRVLTPKLIRPLPTVFEAFTELFYDKGYVNYDYPYESIIADARVAVQGLIDTGVFILK